MNFQAFLLMCVVGVVVTSVFFRCRYKALLFGCVGFVAAYAFEMGGISRGEWDYEGVDTLLMLTGVPVEILVGYFTACFFTVVLIDNVPDISTRERREYVLRHALLIAGVLGLAYSYSHDGASQVVGWAFLGIFGLSISPDMSVPLTVGLCAFAADWAVEWMLTSFMEYYSAGWNATIALVFMFAAMFAVGVLLNLGTIARRLPAWSSAEGTP